MAVVSDRKTPDQLPGPADRPLGDVLIYDGQCQICRAQMARLHRWDTRGEMGFLSLHDPETSRRFPDLSREALMREMVLVDRNGRRHHGADAARYLSRRIPRLWPLVPLMHLPGIMPLWRWCYRRLAHWRYRLGGRVACDSDQCDLHYHK